MTIGPITRFCPRFIDGATIPRGSTAASKLPAGLHLSLRQQSGLDERSRRSRVDRAEPGQDRQDLSHGGIPYGRQEITEEDIEAVAEVLRSDFLTQGPPFQRSSGPCRILRGAPCRRGQQCTSALHIACLALGVGPGDAVWTSAITFVASANCALYCGAAIDFVDIDPRTYNMSVSASREAGGGQIGRTPAEGRDSGASLRGNPATCGDSRALRSEYGFMSSKMPRMPSAAAIGGNPSATGRYSAITVFSFHPGKDHYHGRRRHGADDRIRSGRPHEAVTYPWHYPRSGRDDAHARRVLGTTSRSIWDSTIG